MTTDIFAACDRAKDGPKVPNEVTSWLCTRQLWAAFDPWRRGDEVGAICLAENDGVLPPTSRDVGTLIPSALDATKRHPLESSHRRRRGQQINRFCERSVGQLDCQHDSRSQVFLVYCGPTFAKSVRRALPERPTASHGRVIGTFTSAVLCSKAPLQTPTRQDANQVGRRGKHFILCVPPEAI